ncbi:MAG: hypothetical protein ACRD8U_22240 [Pyrinomonadaceae bacterium]
MNRLLLLLIALTAPTAITFAQSDMTQAPPASTASPVASPSPVPKTNFSNPTPAATPAPSPTSAATPEAPAPSSPASSSQPAVKGAVVLPPEIAKPVTVPKFEKPPVIDGKLDDYVLTVTSAKKTVWAFSQPATILSISTINYLR